MKKILLVGYYGFGNFGDELMRVSIKEFLLEKNYYVYELLPKNNMNKNSYNRFNPISILKAILKADVIICGGGGVLQDKTSFKSLLYYYLIFRTVLLLNKPLIFFGNSFGPFKNYFSRHLIKNLFQNKKLYIFARDQVSYKYTKLFNKNTFLYTDPAIRKLSEISINNDKNNINHKKAVIIPRKIKNYIPILFNLKQEGINEVIYIPFAPEDKFLAKKLSNFTIKGVRTRYSENIIEEITNSKIVITERFHGALISAFFEKPFISINDEKFRRFFWKYSKEKVFYARDLLDASIKITKVKSPQVSRKMLEETNEMYKKLGDLILNL